MNKSLVLIIAMLASSVCVSADMANGKALSSQCSACHGKNGLARDPETPNLAGLSSLYIEKALVDYKKGSRHDRRMSLIAQSLTKPQIKDLAAWYSAFEVTVKTPKI